VLAVGSSVSRCEAFRTVLCVVCKAVTSGLSSWVRARQNKLLTVIAEDARQLSARTRPITIRPLWGTCNTHHVYKYLFLSLLLLQYYNGHRCGLHCGKDLSTMYSNKDVAYNWLGISIHSKSHMETSHTNVLLLVLVLFVLVIF
jgi:hypothetical protein